jgi:hypothetical protein
VSRRDQPTPPPAWLADDDAFFRPLDYFAVQVVGNPALSPNERREAARAYARRWGLSALREAFSAAEQVGLALPAELRALQGPMAGRSSS